MQAQDVSCDGNKKVKGRTRPIVVDTLGLLVEVVTKTAKTDDRQERVVLLQRSLGCLGDKRLRKIGVDAGEHTQWLYDRGRSLK